MEKKITSTTTKGSIIALILMVIALIIYFLNIDSNGPVKWLQLILFVAGVIWAVMSYGKEINYNSTIGNYFGYGFKVSAVATVILIIYTVIFILIFPDVKETALEQARKNMIEKNVPTDQMQQGMEFTKKFFMVFAIVGLLIVNLLCGAIAALVGAAVTKKEPNQLPQQDNQLAQ
jgi:ABC-type multidrug transport system permease subunit